MTAEEFYNRFEFNPSMSGSLLGRGGFSSVHKVYDKVRKRYVAIKRSEVGAFAKFDLDREVRLANEIEYHPNIVRYENVERVSDRSGTYDYAILKYYAEGNLDDVLSRHRLSDAERRQILTGILHGLAHLHRIPIIHRDFKAANVLMDRDAAGQWTPVIADFGLSRLVDMDMSFVLNNSQIAITPNYAAPEQYKDNEALRPNTDLWAFGVMTYKMMTGRLPFRAEVGSGERDSSNIIRNLILDGKMPGDLGDIAQPYQNMIRQCLVQNPEKRVKRAEDLLALLTDESQVPPPRAKSSSQAPPPPKPPRAEAPPKPGYEDRTKVKPNAAPPVPDATTLIQPKAAVPPPPTIPDLPAKPRKMGWMALTGVLFVGFLGLGWWIMNEPSPAPSPTPEPVVLVDTAPAVEADTSLAVSVPKNPAPASKKLKPTVAKPKGSGQLEISAVYHDLKVFIDGVPQSKIVRAGQTVTYPLPVSEGVFYKVEYVDYGVGPRAEPLNVSAGQVFRRSFKEKFN